MKKRALILLFAALTLLLVFSSCKKDGLNIPGNLAVDENNLLSWSAVTSARTYTIEIKNAAGEEVSSKSTRKTSYSLSDLAEGDYVIRIMAVGGEDNDKTSDWSDPFSFHRDYESGCEYELINGNTEYRIVNGRKASGDVRIEATYRGKPVTEIADNAFKGNRNIVSVTLGENIRSIGESAFYNCGQLTSVTVPDSVTFLGVSAFQGCRSLTTVQIPRGIETIPELCFAYCRALTSITIGDNIKTIGSSAFTNTGLTSVVTPDSVTLIGDHAFADIADLMTVSLGSGVVSLDMNAFSDCPKLTTVTFSGNNLISIGSGCFARDVSLSGIVLPESVTTLDNSCFYNCTALTEIRIPAAVTRIGSNAFNASGIYVAAKDFVYADNWLVGVKDLNAYQKIQASDFRAGTIGIADSCFAGAAKLESLILPNELKYIGSYAVSSCPLLAEFRVGSSLLTIGYGCFMNDEALYKISLSPSNGRPTLTEIGAWAFAFCSLLDNNAYSSIIPSSVVSIGAQAFYQTMLWNNTSEDNIIYAGNWVVGFKDGAKLGAATLKDGVIGISDYAFRGCDSLVSLVGLSNCIYIGEGAFFECASLETVVLHARITALPDYVFYKCSRLYRVDFPLMLESIGRSAFYKCTMLKALDFRKVDEEGTVEEITPFLTSIGKYAFYGCTNLERINFPGKLSEISEYAFSHCEALLAVTVPENVTVLNRYVFSTCTSLASLTISEGVTEIADNAFYKCSALTSVTIPDSVVSIGANAFYKCLSIESLTLGSSLQSIGNYAFYNVKGLRALELPASLTSIGQYAFKSAEQLEVVILHKGITTIGAHAFYGCKRVTFYVEEGTDTANWNVRWNSSNRPVVRNAKLSETGDYVLSVTVSEGSVLNNKSLAEDIAPTAAPTRAGYTFSGWQRQDGTVISTADLAGEPTGTVLTALWTPET